MNSAPATPWSTTPGPCPSYPDCAILYMLSIAALTPGAEEATGESRNLYVERDGQVGFVAKLEEAPVHVAVSPDGRYLAFDTYTPLGGNVDSSPACTERFKASTATRVPKRRVKFCVLIICVSPCANPTSD